MKTKNEIWTASGGPVILINPPSFTPSPLFLDVHLGLLNLHAVLVMHGIECCIFDCNSYVDCRRWNFIPARFVSAAPMSFPS